jgi:hypothetical protein
MSDLRRRRAAGLVALSIEVPEVETVEALIASGFLASTAADDRGALRLALEQFIAAAVTASRHPISFRATLAP